MEKTEFQLFSHYTGNPNTTAWGKFIGIKSKSDYKEKMKLTSLVQAQRSAKYKQTAP